MSATLAGLLGIACGPVMGEGDESVASDGSSGAGEGPGTATPQDDGDEGDGTGTPSSCEAPMTDAACEGDVQWVVGDQERQGWMQCANGLVHRPAAAACVLPAADECEGAGGDSGTGGDYFGECTVDAECSDAANGRCLVDWIGDSCFCNYGCQTDDDCSDDQACLCNGTRSQCVPAECQVDSDCGEGSSCTLELSDLTCGISSARLRCTTSADSCNDNGDCSTNEGCAKDTGACGFQCEPTDNGCADAGRPFIVDHENRTAEACVVDGWCGHELELADAVAELPLELRERVAEHWTRGGLAEHASVASFARFLMQLMALGAPADLVEQAQGALADEIDHARRCFAIASVYAGHAVGPGPLSMNDALDAAQGLLAITEAVIREGCVGETLAAAEVAEASQWAQHPEIRAALSAIADDELRHAALAWRFVDWALDQASDHDARRILALLDEVLAQARRVAPASAEPPKVAARAHGMLSRAERKAVHAKALDAIVLPCAQRLKARERAARQPRVA